MLIYFISFIVFMTSILVVTSNNPITSVTYLIATFICTAIYLSLQGIYYIAMTYIIVYVGAVVTLFLFVVIIINLGTENNNSSSGSLHALFNQTLPLIIIIIIVSTILIVSSNSDIFLNSYFNTIFPSLFQYFVNPDLTLHTFNNIPRIQNVNEFSISLTCFVKDSAAQTVNNWNQIQSIGLSLYTHFAMYLVLVSIILIISIIGPIVICASSTSRSN